MKILLVKPHINLELILFKGRRSNGVSSGISAVHTSEVKIDSDVIYFIVTRIM